MKPRIGYIIEVLRGYEFSTEEAQRLIELIKAQTRKTSE